MSDYFVHKFGRNSDIAVAEDITDIGSDTVWPSVAFETSIVGLANDIPSSDGVHSVQIEGLDINGIEISEVASLTGATPVVLANSYYRVNRAYVKAVGATLINSGIIDITHTGSANLARISPLQGQTLKTTYTMPAGVRGSFLNWRASAARAGSRTDVAASMALQTRNNGEGWRTRDSCEAGNTSPIGRKFETGAVTLKPLTDIRLRCTAINTDTVVIAGGFEIKGFRDVR